MQSLARPFTVTDAAVDYITLTSSRPAYQAALVELKRRILAQEHQRGNDLDEWRWQGYVGEHAGSASWGVRTDGSILRLSGQTAAAEWREAVQLATNVSRLDLQVTVRSSDPDARLASRAYRYAQRYPCTGVGRDGRGRPPSLRLVTSPDQGETLYVGSRKSDVLARLYDKARESKDLAQVGAWRYEVQYRDAQACVKSAWLNIQPDVASSIVGGVHGHFSARGVLPVFDFGVEVNMPQPEKSQTDAQRKLVWLQTQVAPVIRKLQEHYTSRQILLVLGFTEQQYQGFRLLREAGDGDSERASGAEK
jgi:hypothetical protein